MGQKLFVAALLLITAAYAWGLGWIAWGFARAGGAVGWGLALGVTILLVLTVWVTWREVLFGMRAGRLGREYGGAPPSAGGEAAVQDDGPGDQDAPGSANRTAQARAEFEAARAAIQEDPSRESDWRAWFRLALAYDAVRDRRNARMATRRAIDLHRGA